MAKMTNIERAKQFLPFNALKGLDEFDGLLTEKTIKIDLDEYKGKELSEIITKIKKNSLVEITYFCCDKYLKKTGAVSEIDLVNRFIKVIKTKIDFADILDVKII